MPALTRWHSRTGKVYHTHPSCPTGRLVRVNKAIVGHGDKPQCTTCRVLSLSYWQKQGMMLGEINA